MCWSWMFFSVQETVLALCPGVQQTNQGIGFRGVFVKGMEWGIQIPPKPDYTRSTEPSQEGTFSVHFLGLL